MSEPSISEANKMLRVLNGARLKYTVRVHLPSKEIVEFQTDTKPNVQWHDQSRCLWLHNGDYPRAEVMPWPEGAIMLVEENPTS